MRRFLHIKRRIVLILVISLIIIPLLVSASGENQGDDATTLTTKGFDLYKVARFQDALISFEKAIALDPYSSLSWYGKGLTSAALNDKEGAIQALDRATELSPKDEQAWLKKGEVYISMNRNDLAITAYKRALLINPNNKEAKRNLELLGVQATPTTADYSQYSSPGQATPTPAKIIPFAQSAGIILGIGIVLILFSYTRKKH
ncbi:MAG: tetratricopeptide repeat protein [Methanoregulaceae archaeon]|jgi:tetratricopeptide (TPR) repeat protein|nr:tetratricopeptide repeat protein [Methanoregulaceae archaeon]